MPRFSNSLIEIPKTKETVKRKRNWSEKSRIEFIRMGGLGDILLCTPVIKALKKTFSYPITFVTSPTYFPLLDGNKDLERVTEEANPNSDSTMVLDLRNELENYSIRRNRQHRIDSIAEFCGVHIDNYKIVLPAYQKEIPKAQKFLKKIKNSCLIGLAPRSAFRLRSWIETYVRDLVELLPDYQFLIFGSNLWYSFPHSRVKSIVGVGLLQLIAFISLCDYFITTDNGLLHIAGALDIPTVALFGSLPPEWRIKYYPNMVPLVSNVKCVPCIEWQSGSEEDRYYCINVDTRCMREIRPEMVVKKLEEFF